MQFYCIIMQFQSIRDGWLNAQKALKANDAPADRSSIIEHLQCAAAVLPRFCLILCDSDRFTLRLSSVLSAFSSG